MSDESDSSGKLDAGKSDSAGGPRAAGTPGSAGGSDELQTYHRPTLPHERKVNPAFRAGGLATAGIEFAVTVGLFLLAGRWLDRTLDAEPWFTVVLTLLGVAAAMTLLIRHATRLGPGPKTGDEEDA